MESWTPWDLEITHNCRTALAWFLTGLKIHHKTQETSRQPTQQRRSSSGPDVSSRLGKSVNATHPLHNLINLLQKQVFFMLSVQSTANKAAIIFTHERDLPLGSWTLSLQAFEGGNKSISELLLPINCAFKFYCVLMICWAWMIYVDSASHSL